MQNLACLKPFCNLELQSTVGLQGSALQGSALQSRVLLTLHGLASTFGLLPQAMIQQSLYACSTNQHIACTCSEVDEANVLVEAQLRALQLSLHSHHICPLTQHQPAICTPGSDIGVAPVVVQSPAVCHHRYLHIHSRASAGSSLLQVTRVSCITGLIKPAKCNQADYGHSDAEQKQFSLHCWCMRTVLGACTGWLLMA